MHHNLEKIKKEHELVYWEATIFMPKIRIDKWEINGVTDENIFYQCHVPAKYGYCYSNEEKKTVYKLFQPRTFNMSFLNPPNIPEFWFPTLTEAIALVVADALFGEKCV